MTKLRALWRNLFHRAQIERNLSEELHSFSDLLTEEKMQRGMSESAARRAALLEIGGIEQVKEQVRDARTGSSWDGLWRDIVHACRSLRKSRSSTAIAVATLALGLGSAALIFSVFYAVLLRPMPFRDPQQLVQLWETRAGQGWERASFSRPNFWDVRSQNRTFESMAALLGSDLNLTGDGEPQHLSAAVISARFFHVLGVVPILGRDFAPNQDQPGQNAAVILLSNRFWRTRFASSKAVLGTTLHLGNRPYTVLGVMPPGEPWLNAGDVFVPLTYDPQTNRGNFEATVIGRLAPGVSIAAAHADLTRIAHDLSHVYKKDEGMGLQIAPAAIWVADPSIRRALWVLLGAVTFLLLIACVNIANLLLAKTYGRSRELRVRVALGASRARIVRLVLTESILLCSLGAGLGLLLAHWGLAFIRAAELRDIPRISDIGINYRVLAFMLAATLLSGMLTGFIPAFQSSSGDVARMLREGDRSQTASKTQNRLRSALVMFEVALSVTLLIGAGLLLRSFSKLLDVERGFNTAHRVIASIHIPLAYDDPRAERVTEAILAKMPALPGVRAAATVNSRPILGWDPGMGFGAHDAAPGTIRAVPWASWRYVSANYFHTMGIPLLQGSRFTEADLHSGEHFRVMISQSVAHLLWPGRSPIGRQIVLWKGQSNHTAEVIGVVGNLRDHGLDADPTRTIYIPFTGQTYSPLQLVVDGNLSPAQVGSSLRSALRFIDPKIPVSDVQSMSSVVSRSLGSKQLDTSLLSVLAAIAVLLAVAGIYGVLTYSVAQRTSEIGIRVALGANRHQIGRLIVRQGMQPIVAGIMLGICGALALTRLLATLLFEIEPADAVTYLSVTVLIASVAFVACLIPARRALRIDPATALREN